MNFLAHLFLGRRSADYMVGNLMGDFVKGNGYRRFDREIQAGILAHRKVDSYTDRHPVFIRSTRRIDNDYRLLKGVMVDVFYDHFLAVHWGTYADQPLSEFADRAYRELQDRHDLLPARLQRMLPYMISGNWLVAYGRLDGIEKVMMGMSRRITRKNNLADSVSVLQARYSEFEQDFAEFFPELIAYSEEIDSGKLY